MTYPNYDALYSISDLHLGGTEGKQIFSGKLELPALLKNLTNQHPNLRIALVINGDFIDFLAEAPGQYFNVDSAIHKLRRVAADATFKASFAAFGDFVSASNRFLIINLGNHDLELAFPDVQQVFAECCGLADAHRIHWVDDGAGFRAAVGEASVLCLHGNEADVANHVDFEALRRFRKLRQLGSRKVQTSSADWTPNAGTQLVIDAMNTVKQDHPFIDVLKPETEAAVRVLLALDFDKVKQLAWPAMRAMGGRGGKDAVKHWFGILSAPQPGEVTQIAAAKVDHAQQMLDAIEVAMNDKLEPQELLSSSDSIQQLGFTEDVMLFWNSMRGKDTTNALRDALEALDYDQSFKFDAPEKMNDALADLVGSDINFLLSGHTHFHRSLRLGPSSQHFNSGTWAYLMHLTEAVRTDKVKFNRLIAALKAKKSLAELDADEHLLKRHTVVRIAKFDASVRGELLLAKLSKAGEFSFDAVPNSERIF